MSGTWINLTRPELSPALARIEDKTGSNYREALSIIRAGTARLMETPRMDMPGARLVGLDRDRQKKYIARAQVAAKTRKVLQEKSQ